MTTKFEKILALALAHRAGEMRRSCPAQQMGVAKDGVPVLGHTPQERLRLRCADTIEELANDFLTLGGNDERDFHQKG